MQIAKKEAVRGFTQFELSTEIITKLNTFNLTPTAKLVLLYLTTCYNPKHKEVFPKQRTIADKIGVSERSVTRAIQELFNEGLILVECKYTNRYKFTSKIVQEQPVNLSGNLGQNDTQLKDNLSVHKIEQKRITKKEQTGNKGGNVYLKSEPQLVSSESDLILRDYAIKHNARNIEAYINTLKSSKSAENIIKEYKKKKRVVEYAQTRYEETMDLIKQNSEYKGSAPTEAWFEFKKRNRL